MTVIQDMPDWKAMTRADLAVFNNYMFISDVAHENELAQGLGFMMLVDATGTSDTTHGGGYEKLVYVTASTRGPNQLTPTKAEFTDAAVKC